MSKFEKIILVKTREKNVTRGRMSVREKQNKIRIIIENDKKTNEQIKKRKNGSRKLHVKRREKLVHLLLFVKIY